MAWKRNLYAQSNKFDCDLMMESLTSSGLGGEAGWVVRDGGALADSRSFCAVSRGYSRRFTHMKTVQYV